MAAPVQGLQLSIAAPHGHQAGTANQVSAQKSDSVQTAPSGSGSAPVKARIDRSGAAPGAEAKSTSADSLLAPAAGNAGAHITRATERFSAETMRAAASTFFSPASAAGRFTAPNAQPAIPEASGVASLLGGTAHILRAGAISAALPSLSSAPATVSAAFTRMDSAAPPQMLGSAPQRLSVGVRDSGLGWVEVHTHAAEGQVSAVLATGSAQAHAALQAHLPELRDYLTSQQVRIDHLGSERFSASGGGREPEQQQQSRSKSSGNADSLHEGPPLSPAFNEGTEERLSYINVRV
jgi:hypothetical protein